MTTILIKGGRVLDPARNVDVIKDVWLEDGIIKSLENTGTSTQNADVDIDAEGLWVTPGLIDMHVHLREPGAEYKETVASGARCAAAAGFTSIVAMPNTSPVLDNAAEVLALLERGRQAGGARVLAAPAMTRGRQGQELNEYDELKEAGAVAVTDDGSWVKNPKVMRRVLDYAATVGLLPLCHAEDHELSKGGVINEGMVSTRLGLPGIPAQVEINAVTRDINMVELTGKPLHFCHISTKGAVEAIRAAKNKGLPVSGETAPHYLFLTEEDVGDYDANYKMNPPLRTAEDQQALREAISDGTLEVIATDHAPHSILEKEVEFIDASFGITGLETSLPLMLELVQQGVISPLKLVELMSYNPARLLKIKAGELTPGYPADITFIDPKLNFTYQPQDSLSLSRNSPFFGRNLIGRAVKTIVGGKII